MRWRQEGQVQQKIGTRLRFVFSEDWLSDNGERISHSEMLRRVVAAGKDPAVVHLFKDEIDLPDPTSAVHPS